MAKMAPNKPQHMPIAGATEANEPSCRTFASHKPIDAMQPTVAIAFDFTMKSMSRRGHVSSDLPYARRSLWSIHGKTVIPKTMNAARTIWLGVISWSVAQRVRTPDADGPSVRLPCTVESYCYFPDHHRQRCIRHGCRNCASKQCRATGTCQIAYQLAERRINRLQRSTNASKTTQA